MNVEITKTNISEVLIFKPRVFGDNRGFFLETFRDTYLSDLGLKEKFVQDNQSGSVRGTLRGLHFQYKFPQGKLVRVVSGEVFDVAVDLRESSPTFGKWVGETLSAENYKQLWVPPGFAHGFYVLSESADLCYKCTNYYSPEDEHTLLWNDPDIAIKWPLISPEPVLSSKDLAAKRLGEIPLFP